MALPEERTIERAPPRSSRFLGLADRYQGKGGLIALKAECLIERLWRRSFRRRPLPGHCGVRLHHGGRRSAGERCWRAAGSTCLA